MSVVYLRLKAVSVSLVCLINKKMGLTFFKVLNVWHVQNDNKVI